MDLFLFYLFFEKFIRIFIIFLTVPQLCSDFPLPNSCSFSPSKTKTQTKEKVTKKMDSDSCWPTTPEPGACPDSLTDVPSIAPFKKKKKKFPCPC